MKTIVCIGDSLVEGEGDELGLGGWVGRLASKNPPQQGQGGIRVFNLGIGGQTIMEVYGRLGEIIPREPDVVIVGCGGNDIKMFTDGTWGDSAEYAIARHQAEKYWRLVLDSVSKFTKNILVLGRSNQPDSFDAGKQRLHKDSLALNEFLNAECQKFGAAFLPASTELMDDDYYSHGSHPNAAGYEVYANHVYSKLKQLKWI